MTWKSVFRIKSPKECILNNISVNLPNYYYLSILKLCHWINIGLLILMFSMTAVCDNWVQKWNCYSMIFIIVVLFFIFFYLFCHIYWIWFVIHMIFLNVSIVLFGKIDDKNTCILNTAFFLVKNVSVAV